MAEDQERILLDQIIKLEETVARLMDQGEKDVQTIAHAADAINKLAVRVTRVEDDTRKCATAGLILFNVVAQMLTRLEELEGKGNDGNETGNEPDGAGVVRDDGGDDAGYDGKGPNPAQAPG